MAISIAIDGPSGAGKSTLSKALAKKLGYIYVDTGAMYRTIGLYVYKNGISPDDIKSVADALDKINIDIKFINGEQRVFLNGDDVSEDIRVHIISDYASKVSAIQSVRDFLLETQRNFAKDNNVVMDGRDIGTVVLPDADVKIYLTASAHKRAERRYNELTQKGQVVNFDDILKDVIDRDNRDMNRDVSPLKVADGAVIIDNTECTFEGSLELLEKTVKEYVQ